MNSTYIFIVVVIVQIVVHICYDIVSQKYEGKEIEGIYSVVAFPVIACWPFAYGRTIEIDELIQINPFYFFYTLLIDKWLFQFKL